MGINESTATTIRLSQKTDRLMVIMRGVGKGQECEMPPETTKAFRRRPLLFNVFWLPDLDSNQGPAD